MNERLNAQPAITSAPRTATALPAIMGTRSKKPINGPWRPDGLSATVFGLAMLLSTENLFLKFGQCNSTRGLLFDRGKIHQSDRSLAASRATPRTRRLSAQCGSHRAHPWLSVPSQDRRSSQESPFLPTLPPELWSQR